MSKKIVMPDYDKLLNEYTKEGTTISSLAKLYNTSNPTIRKWLIYYNIERKSQKQASTEANNRTVSKVCSDVHLLEKMVEEGESLNSLKNKFGVTSTQLEVWLKENSLEIKPNKFLKKEKPTKKDIIEYMKMDKTYQDMCSYFNVSYPTLMKWLKEYDIMRSKEKISNIMVKTVSDTKMKLYGYKYYPNNITNTSKGETEMINILNEMGGNFRKKHIYLPNGDRRELDMYDENLKLAIEFSGAYWHSEKFKHRKYHYEKWKHCNDIGIQLLTFWDIEYEKRKPQILSFIKSKMGVFDKRIYARNLQFKEINQKQYSFFGENHIQGGKCNIDRNFGLIDNNNELMACVSFSNHHRDNKKYTLNRLAFKSGVQILGGVGKLISNSFNIIGTDIITWSDNRYSTGKIYEQNGFVFEAHLPIDYSYFDKNKRTIISKQSQQKSKNGCPDNMSEKEYCESIGLIRLWDCGKKRFSYKHETNR